MAGELNVYLDGVHAGTFAQTAQGSLSFSYERDCPRLAEVRMTITA